MASESETSRRVGVVLFDGFELLDVFGPVELLAMVPGVELALFGPDAGPVSSSQGSRVIAERSYADMQGPDILLVPGGAGTRVLVTDQPFLSWLRGRGQEARLVTSVCTGSAVLAAAGLLNGYRATSNKLAFEWARTFGADVNWQPKARWVEDRDRWTSSGVAAGMDMTAALIGRLFGPDAQRMATDQAEYEPQRDGSVDPFARVHGIA